MGSEAGRVLSSSTRFVGRSAAVDGLVAELRPGRVVTLTGPAGAGTSRWAGEVASRPLPGLPDGPWRVELGSAAPACLAEHVAVTVGAPTAPGVSAERGVLRHLRSAQGLLVLDGCDGVRRETARLVELVRRCCPAVRLLVTARAPLGVEGEVVRPVVQDPGLAACPPSAAADGSLWTLADAVELFRARSAAGAEHRLELGVVRQLCGAVSGLPLAVELLAARAGDRPDEALPLPHPTGVPVGVQLVDVAGWSYRLLAPLDREVLDRLSAFRGTFTAADAEAVAGDGLPAGVVTLSLSTLTRAGLLAAHQRSIGDQAIAVARFALLEPIRALAAGRLRDTGRSARIRDRHADYWAQVAAVAEQGLHSRDQAAWVQRLETDRANLGAALRWLAGRGDPEPALQMAGALGTYWWLSGRFGEGARALRTILDRPEAQARTGGRGAALHALGLATYWHETDDRRAERAGAWIGEAVQIYGELGDRRRLAWALRDLGSHRNGAGDLTRARSLFRQSLHAARELGDIAATAVALSCLGIAACYAGDRTEAREHFEEATVLLSGRGGADELVRAQFFLACLECDDGHPRAARARFKALVEGHSSIPTVPYAIGFALDGLARLAVAEDRPADALRLAGAAAATHRRLGSSAGGAYQAYVARGLETARAAVGEAAAEAYAQEGSRWTVEQAVRCGFSADRQPAAAARALRPREVQVLRLVDQGLSDAEIAKRLVLSQRTVGNHLASAYRTLGVHSRTAALHLVRRRGLLTA